MSQRPSNGHPTTRCQRTRGNPLLLERAQVMLDVRRTESAVDLTTMTNLDDEHG